MRAQETCVACEEQRGAPLPSRFHTAQSLLIKTQGPWTADQSITFLDTLPPSLLLLPDYYHYIIQQLCSWERERERATLSLGAWSSETTNHMHE